MAHPCHAADGGIALRHGVSATLHQRILAVTFMLDEDQVGGHKYGSEDTELMVLRVAVTDPFPLFRHGVRAALAEAGLNVERPEDLLAWARIDEPRLLLFTIRTAQDWHLLAELCQVCAGTIIIAVLDDASLPAYVRALNAGAAAVLPRDATLHAMREVVDAAVRGGSLVPTTVLQALAAGTGSDQAVGEPGHPSSAERDWLRRLAHGESVAKVAAQVGYSERMMFRLLRDLYTKIGVNNRTAALIKARDEGWL
jgi:DNA-binding NarL/FixJ family response regulator